jgi:DNA ligase (NAD+)
LGIRHVGERTAKLLANHYGSIKNLISTTLDELTAIHEIGPEIAESIVDFFHEQKNINCLNKFFKAGINPQKKVSSDERTFAGGIVFFLPVTMENMGRNEAPTIVENLGGTIHSQCNEEKRLCLRRERSRFKTGQGKDSPEFKSSAKMNF